MPINVRLVSPVLDGDQWEWDAVVAGEVLAQGTVAAPDETAAREAARAAASALERSAERALLGAVVRTAEALTALGSALRSLVASDALYDSEEGASPTPPAAGSVLQDV